ncbi:metallophosphoesterase family protein [Kineococcus sp. SYSU DK003]|uniref:metallophosphoesterase family protein n=1 Tax=Kineococcus sp. SYSU DK003 TaxID=3383124 RepID=UPI003D7C95ED
MTHLVVVSDTHLPSRAKDLPAPVWAAVESADVVVHAGDWCDEATVLALQDRSAQLVGVAGNNDGPDVRGHLPQFATFSLDGVRFGVVHETGGKDGRERRCDAAYADDLDVLLFGHSHIPWDSLTPRGLRLLNPGSPTDRRRMPTATWLELDVLDGALRGVELKHVPRR